MNAQDAKAEMVPVDALVKDLLGLEPSSLAAMVPPGRNVSDATMVGLQTFLRCVMRLAIDLGTKPDVTLALQTETSAKALGWPDARTANLGILLVWALIREPRWYNSLAFVPLRAARTAATSLVPTTDIAESSFASLIRELTKMPSVKGGKGHEAPETYPVSICGLIEEMLAVDPAALAARFTDKAAEASVSFAKTPDAMARFGLDQLVHDAIEQHRVMRERNVDRIRLMTDEDARIAGRPSARIANTITLLSGALLADDVRDVVFEAPRPRHAEEEVLLRAAARHVYLDYSDEAMEGLELLCDGRVNFGSFGRFSRAEQLLASVGREVDPEGKRMPFMVAVQTSGFDAFATRL